MRDVELIEHVAQFGALVTLHAARNATATRVVGHQHQIAAGQRDVGGQRRALVAALVLFHLNDDFLADVECILNASTRGLDIRFEISAGDFLEGEEPVTVSAVIDESRFQAGFQAGDDCLIDIALALFLGGRLDVEVNEFLTINNRDTEFFGLCRIEKHALHVLCAPARKRGVHRPDARVACLKSQTGFANSADKCVKCGHAVRPVSGPDG